MEISYKRMHSDSFMVIEQQNSTMGYETRMVEENEIAALLPVSRMQMNGNTFLHYNISRKESLMDFIETEELDLKILERIILYIHLCLEETDKYLIDQNHIFLSAETIFLEKGTDNFSISLCYLPQDNGSIQSQFSRVLEEIMPVINADNRKVSEMIYRLYDITLKEEYTLKELLEVIREDEISEIHVEQIELDEATPAYQEEPELMEDSTQEYSKENINREAEYLSDYYGEDYLDKPSIVDKILGMIKGVKKKTEEASQNMVFEDFYVDPDYENEERTVLLNKEEQKCIGKLIYDGTKGEDSFVVNKDIFKIGSSKKNDGIIHSKAVSANHAKIIRENGEYFLEDMNSLNGSIVSGKVVNYRERVKLKQLDQVLLGDVAYIFM